MADDSRYQRIRAANPLRDYLARIGVHVDRAGVFKCVNPNGHDRNPSAKINPTDPDKWQCFGCGEKGDIIDLKALAEGLTAVEAANALDGGPSREPPPNRPPPRQEKPKLHIVRGDYGPVPDDAPKPKGEKFTYWFEPKERPGEWVEKTERFTHLFPYRDASGQLQAYVLRSEWLSKQDGKKRKRIIPLRWNLVARRFDMMGFTGREARPLYHADQLASRPNAEVLLVEGEKTADVAAAIFTEMVVTTWIGGTGQVKESDYSDLKGRHLTLWADNDAPGAKAMAHIASVAEAKTTLMVPIHQTWGPKWDLEDVAGLGPGNAEAALKTRQPYRRDVSPNGQRGLWDKVKDGGWLPDHLEPVLGSNGLIKVDYPYNAELALTHHPDFNHLQWDIVRNRIVWQAKTVPPATSLGFISGLLNRTTGLVVSNGYEQIVETAARARPVNPLADEILGTVWDQKPRIDALWCYLGLTSNTDWNLCAPKRWFLGLVNRILHPGAQSDLMLILEGPQGIGKTSALKLLAQPFGYPGYVAISGFGSASTLNAADMMMLSGKLLVEMTEMTAHRRAEEDYFKGMLSKTEDRYRSPYGRHFHDVPRTASFAGSTNRRDPYLTDTTGGRRFVPVLCDGQIDLRALQDDCDQLYAEAAVLLQHGEQPYFTAEEEDLQDEEVAKRTAVSLIREQIEDIITAYPDNVIQPYMLHDLLGVSNLPFHEKLRAKPLIDAAMAELGWEWSDRTRLTNDPEGRRVRAWTRGKRRPGRPPKPIPARPPWWPK